MNYKSATISALFLWTFVSVARADVTITNLGVDSFAATAMNADGTVVVGGSGVYGSSGAFRWTSTTGMQYLGGLSGYGRSVVRGVSSDGSVVVGYCDNSTSVAAIPFRWTAETGMEAIQSPPEGLCGSGNPTLAMGVSGDGTVIVGIRCPGNSSRPIRWTAPATPIDIGGEGQYSSSVYATNRDGSVSCGWRLIPAQTGTSSFLRAAMIGNGNPQLLETLNNFSDSIALCLTPDGHFVGGYSSDTTGQDKAVRWNAAGQIQNLGSLPNWLPGGNPGPGQNYRATGISEDGRIIVGSADSNNPGEERGFLWTEALGMVGLNEYLTSLGFNLASTNLKQAVAVSADGSVIAGTGTFDGQLRSFLIRGLHLVAPLCPADLNANRVVDAQDLAVLLAFWGPAPVFAQADINGDQIVDSSDLAFILSAWGSCPN